MGWLGFIGDCNVVGRMIKHDENIFEAYKNGLSNTFNKLKNLFS